MPGPAEPRYIIPVTQGGTGNTQFAEDEIVLGNGKSPLKTTTDLPSGITLNGSAILRTDTYNQSVYGGGNISIGTTNDGAYADVDATNAQITFTVNVPGRYLVSFAFQVQADSTVAAANFSSFTRFRLTDGTNNSNTTEFGGTIGSAAAAGKSHTLWNLFIVDHVFNFTSSGSKTVKLQKQNIVSTDISVRRILCDGTDGSIVMKAFRIAD